MVAANRIAVWMGMLGESDAERIEALIERVGLPTRVGGLDLATIFEAHLHDKKFSRRTNRFVLPAGIGRAKVVSGVKERFITHALRECGARASN
jgi:3-dehydroquinate synthase